MKKVAGTLSIVFFSVWTLSLSLPYYLLSTALFLKVLEVVAGPLYVISIRISLSLWVCSRAQSLWEDRSYRILSEPKAEF